MDRYEHDLRDEHRGNVLGPDHGDRGRVDRDLHRVLDHRGGGATGREPLTAPRVAGGMLTVAAVLAGAASAVTIGSWLPPSACRPATQR